MGCVDISWASRRLTPDLKQAKPLYMVDDIASAERRFGAMGFMRHDNGTEDKGKQGCVGMKAGDSEIMLLDASHAERALPAEVLPSLKHGPALYIWVESLDETRRCIVDPVIGEMVTGYGTWELFVESRIGLIIFAEKLVKSEHKMRLLS